MRGRWGVVSVAEKYYTSGVFEDVLTILLKVLLRFF